MKNYKILFLLSAVPFFLSNGIKHTEKIIPFAEVKWSGTVSFYQKTTGSEGFIWDWRMDGTYTNDTGTANHTSKYSYDQGSGQCRNQGKSQLEVGIDEETKTYSIMAYVPGCIGTQTRSGSTSEYPVTDETGIAINNQPLRTDHTVLSGRLLETIPSTDGATTTIYEWYLVQGPIDVELIVIPENYDTWKPIPGPNETTAGSTINVRFKLQRRGGGPPPVKAKGFELNLSNTSRIPGNGLSTPAITNTIQPPDIRLLEAEEQSVYNEGQMLVVPCEDGITGYATIGAFDSRGRTVLVVEAGLESGGRIKGTLLLPNGITEIPLPKRP